MFFPKKEKEEEDIIKLFLSSSLYIHVYILPKLKYIYACISFEVKGSQVYMYFSFLIQWSKSELVHEGGPKNRVLSPSTSRPHFTNKITTKTQFFFHPQ